MYALKAGLVRGLWSLMVLSAIFPGVLSAGKIDVKERLNLAVGRELYVEPSDIPEKVHTWADVQRWYPPRGEDPLRMAYPEELKGSGFSTIITVRVIITPEGLAINPTIENLKRKELAIPALLHVAGLKFQVPKIDGKPIYLTQKVKLICSEDPNFGRKN